MYQNGRHNHLFKRTLCDNTTLYQLQGKGKPFILLHGLLSDGEDLFPLAQELHENWSTCMILIFQVWDGLLKQEKNLLDIYLNVVKKLLEKATNGAHLIDIHSVRLFFRSIGTRVHR